MSALRAAGHEVMSVDRVGSDADIALDLCDGKATRAALAAAHPDGVVHLAAIATPFSAPEARIFSVNTGMAFSVLEAAVSAGAGRVLVASSPTVLGYGDARWRPRRLPLDEREPVQPTQAYALSKVCVEETVRAMALAHPDTRFACFRPCYVVAPEEWDGAPTQQGHTVVERLLRPELAAVSLFNYVDACDAAEFVLAWLGAGSAPTGASYFVGADDALAVRPLTELISRYYPTLADLAEGLNGTESAFDCGAAFCDVGWRARRNWRTELPESALGLLEASEIARTDLRTP